MVSLCLERKHAVEKSSISIMEKIYQEQFAIKDFFVVYIILSNFNMESIGDKELVIRIIVVLG